MKPTKSQILGHPLDPTREYSVGLVSDLGFGGKFNKPLIEWGQHNPGKVPHDDQALPVIELIAGFVLKRNFS